MSDRWDLLNGCTQPGQHGRATHHGMPLTVEQILALPDRAEIVVTWDNGNGPWPYRVLVDQLGVRCVESAYADPLLAGTRDQVHPLNRVTRGWDDAAREWASARPPLPHVVKKWAHLRGDANVEERP